MILPRDEIEFELASIWESVTGVQPVGVTDSFFDVGGGSLAAEWMLLEVERKFRRKVPQRVLFEAKTIAEMATILRDEGWQARQSAIVALQPGGTRSALYCFPPLNAIYAFHGLAGYLGADQPVFALQATPEGDRNPFSSIEAEAAQYVVELIARQPSGPFYLTGWSYGGIVAFEVAQQLAQHGRQTAFLGILDIGFTLNDIVSTVGRMQRRLAYILTLGPAAQWQRVLRRASLLAGEKIPPDPRLRATSFPLPAPGNDFRADYERARRYRPRKYAGRVTFFATRRDDYASRFRAPARGWERLASGGLDIYNIGGTHASMMVEPHVAGLAAVFMRSLRSAQERQNAE